MDQIVLPESLARIKMPVKVSNGLPRDEPDSSGKSVIRHWIIKNGRFLVSQDLYDRMFPSSKK